MRTNGFGEKYFSDAEEARIFLNDHPNGWEVHVSQIDPPEEGSEFASVEVRENESGDTVCYLEADTVEGVEELIEELQIEVV